MGLGWATGWWAWLWVSRGAGVSVDEGLRGRAANLVSGGVWANCLPSVRGGVRWGWADGWCDVATLMVVQRSNGGSPAGWACAGGCQLLWLKVCALGRWVAVRCLMGGGGPIALGGWPPARSTRATMRKCGSRRRRIGRGLPAGGGVGGGLSSWREAAAVLCSLYS